MGLITEDQLKISYLTNKFPWEEVKDRISPITNCGGVELRKLIKGVYNNPIYSLDHLREKLLVVEGLMTNELRT